MNLRGTLIENTHAEAFPTWACRLIVTASDPYWLQAAVAKTTGYGTSILGCDAEVGPECWLEPAQTPDSRCGAAILFFAMGPKSLAQAVTNRVGQCIMTCPTTAVFDGMRQPHGDDPQRFELGSQLQFFGDQHQQLVPHAGRSMWRIPVMDGDFLVEDTAGAIRAVGGGNFLICGESQPVTLSAAKRAAEAIAPLRDVITPFPGGVVRCGSKVGSQYPWLSASTNDAYCPTLRHTPGSKLRETVACVYEIVIDGLDRAAVARAMRAGIDAACGPGILGIDAGRYEGKLGDIRFDLHQVMENAR
jgi:formylmethanofuran--tetrahydromethanopterin N-formyltransferase